MLILGLDLETQSLDPDTNITEIGACLYENRGICKRFSDGHFEEIYEKKIEYSQLIYEKAYPPQTELIVELTGITDQMLLQKGVALVTALHTVLDLIGKADIVMAHNKAFDETVLENSAKRHGIDLPKKEWICTKFDVEWPKKYTCHKLSHLALDHGIVVDPKNLHRASGDVDLMMNLISHYHLEDILKYARTPWVLIKANIHKPWDDNGVQKEIAVKLGFSWEKIKYLDNVVPVQPKTWIKRMKADKVVSLMLEIDKSASPFKVEEIKC